VVAGGGTGPLTTTRFVRADLAARLRAEPGIERADPFIQARDVIENKDVNVLGVTVGGLGAPKVVRGRALRAPGEVVLDGTLGDLLGRRVMLGGRASTVVGLSRHTTYYFGQ